VRDVVAHCAAALSMTVQGSTHRWTAEDNDRDIAERRPWPTQRLLDELADGYQAAAKVIEAAGGPLDGLALGEWVHGGDIRHALAIADAYASAGIEDALVLLAERSRLARFTVPPTLVRLPGGEFVLGTPPASADLDTDPATLVRLCAGRSPHPGRYRLTGAEAWQYVMFD
jgi:uncharacterized protein (TIGR03083 family)